VVEGILRKPTTTEIATIGIKTYRHAVKMSTVPSAGGTVSSGDLSRCQREYECRQTTQREPYFFSSAARM
jgi:hypothetical protein